MRLNRCVLAVLSILIGSTSWALMQEGATHNFTDGIGSDGWFSRDNSCSACHIPLEKPAEPMMPLWDKEYKYEVFPLYRSGELKKRHAEMSSATMMCVGCHDGSIGPEFVLENDASPSWFKRNHPVGIKYDQNLLEQKYYTPVVLRDVKRVLEPNMEPSEFEFLSTTPVTRTDSYDHERTFRQLRPPQKLRLPLYKGRIECTTCHDPHQRNENLLRLDQDPWICSECHIL